MNSIKLLIAGAVTLLVILIVASQTVSGNSPSGATTQSAADAGVLKIGVMDTVPVYSETTKRGFDTDMATEIASGLGLKAQIVPMDFAQLIPSLKSGKIDMIASQMTVTAERKKEIAFTDPYFDTYYAFTGPVHGPVQRARDINGRTIAVVSGTIEEDWLKEKHPEQGGYNGSAKVVRVNNAAEAAKKVSAGQADAFFFDAPFMDDFIKSAKPMKTARTITFAAENAPIAFGVRQGDPLKARVNKVLNNMLVDGDWMKLKKQYFKDYPLSDTFKNEGVE